jgi:hypothetical protein
MGGACWRLGRHSRPPLFSALLLHTYEVLVLDTEYGVSKSEFKTRYQYYEQTRLWRLLPIMFCPHRRRIQNFRGGLRIPWYSNETQREVRCLGNRSNRFIQEASLSVVNDPTAKASKHAHFSRAMALAPLNHEPILNAGAIEKCENDKHKRSRSPPHPICI